MMSRVFCHTVILLLSVVYSCLGQDSKACGDMLRASVAKTALQNDSAGEITAVYQLHVKTVLTDKKINNGRVEAKVSIGVSPKVFWVKTNEVELYKDSNEVFSVVPTRRLIMRTDAKAYQRQDMMEIQKKLFDGNFPISCKHVTNKNGLYDKEITLVIPTAMQKKLRVAKAVYYINSATGLVNKVQVSYIHHSTYTSQEITYLHINQHPDMSLFGPVKDRFLDNKGKLNTAYAKYQLVDHRNKK